MAIRGATRPARRGGRGRVPAPAPPVDEPLTLLAARRSPFTRRATVFASLLLLIAVSLAFPAQRFVAQRKHIADLRGQIAAGSAQVAGLERQLALREQSFYVERQARLRLHYVLPGEQALRVTDPPPAPGSAAAAARTVAAGAWWGRLLDSVSKAATPIERLPAGPRPGAGVGH